MGRYNVTHIAMANPDKQERRAPVPANLADFKLKVGTLPSKLQPIGAREDILLRTGRVKAYANSLGLEAPEGLENDPHFWSTVVAEFTESTSLSRQVLTTSHPRIKPATRRRTSQEVGIRSAMRQAEALIKKDQEILTDGLTGAWSRLALDRYIHHLIKTNPDNSFVGILFIDIDDFNQVNNENDHQFGDAMLIKIADELKKRTRDTDMVGRYGGDEFAVVLPNMPSVQRLARKAAELGKAIEDTTDGITASIGVTTVEPFDVDTKSVYRRADQAAYAAKYLGRNTQVYQIPQQRGDPMFVDLGTQRTHVLSLDVLGNKSR